MSPTSDSLMTDEDWNRLGNDLEWNVALDIMDEYHFLRAYQAEADEELPCCYGSVPDEDDCPASCIYYEDCRDEAETRHEEDLDWEDHIPTIDRSKVSF